MSENGGIGNSKSQSLYKSNKEADKTVRINFFKTMESNQKLRTTGGKLNEEKNSWNSARELCVILTYWDTIPHSQVSWQPWKTTAHIYDMGYKYQREQNEHFLKELYFVCVFFLTCLVARLNFI